MASTIVIARHCVPVALFSCTVRTTKNKRKGHPNVFRLDISRADSLGKSIMQASFIIN